MKKILAVLTVWLMVCSSAITCYAGECTWRDEGQKESFGIYVTYKEGTADYYTAAVQNGTSEIKLSDGTVLMVSGIPDDSFALVVYQIVRENQGAWQWFQKCMEGKGTDIIPLEVYFLDKNGSRFAADGVTVKIKLAENLEIPAVFSLKPDEIGLSLDFQLEDGSIIFKADGSPYYIFSESEEKTQEGQTSETPGDQSETGQSAADSEKKKEILASGAKTGDTTQAGLWLEVFIIAAGSICVICKNKKENS